MSDTGSTVMVGLETIKDGQVPECRMSDAQACQDYVRKLINDDDKRSKKRALVSGLVDGNPPYNWRKLREAGSASRCNVNWGTGRAYVEAASGAYYDLTSQAPGFVQIEQSFGESYQDKVDYGRIMSQIADSLFADDPDFDNDDQLSQNEMTLHGSGPLWFEDEDKVFPISVASGDLLVPNRTRSKVSRWEFAAILWDYYPPELFEFIRDESASEGAGWNVAYTKSVIENAIGQNQEQGKRRNWEWYQNEMKSNSFSYRNDTLVCKVAHCFWKEFDGRITHGIVQRITVGPTAEEKQARKDKGDEGATKYLFLKVGRYESMEQAIHSMYLDRGREGYHHHVTGLGTKLYGAMEYENRLLCNMMDKAFAPKTLFKATTQEAMTKFQLATYSDYAVVPPGIDVNQNPIQGFLQDGLAMQRTSGDIIRSNLSANRQQVAPEKPGNPITAFEKKVEVSEQSSLSATTFNRYYKQRDSLCREIVRRMCLPGSTDPRAKEFRKRCMDEGVPEECFKSVTSVKAVRVIGQGSPFMRQQTVQGLMPVIGGCSEDGQNNWRNDFIAAYAGQSAVPRYNPQPKSSQMASDQQERANNQVANMKVGVQAKVTASQNPTVFATTFLQACTDALGSLQQGADPHEVVQFLDLAAPAAHAHIQRMAQDKMKEGAVKALMQRWQQVAQATDKLKEQLAQQAKEQQDQQQKAADQMSDQALKAQKVQGDMALKAQKQQHALQQKDAKLRVDLQDKALRTRADLAEQQARTKQDLALADAEMAADIQRKNAQHMADKALAATDTE